MRHLGAICKYPSVEHGHLLVVQSEHAKVAYQVEHSRKLLIVSLTHDGRQLVQLEAIPELATLVGVHLLAS